MTDQQPPSPFVPITIIRGGTVSDASTTIPVATGTGLHFPQLRLQLPLSRQPEELWIRKFQEALQQQLPTDKPATIQAGTIQWTVPTAVYDKALAAIKAAVNSANQSMVYLLRRQAEATHPAAEQADAANEKMAERQQTLDEYDWG